MSRRQPQHYQCFEGLAPISDVKKCIRHGHPVLILMRGPPGCGKTHLAEELVAHRTVDAEDTRAPAILSTDRFFLTPAGRYAFDHSRLDEFHKKNQAEAKAAMESNRSPVIIDNTNMQLAHMKQYISCAIKCCYEIYIIEPTTQWRKDARELARRNKHFVSEPDIERMLAAYEPIPRFADLLKPVGFVINRVELSDDEEELQQVQQPMRPLALNVVPSLAPANSSSPSPSATTTPATSLLPPGLFSPQPLQQLQLPQQAAAPSPIFSMSHELLVSVHQRDVACQATPAIGLWLEMDREEPAEVSALCCTVGSEPRVSQRRRGATTADAETDAARPAPTPAATFAAAFPDVPSEDVEQWAPALPVGSYADMLLTMGYSMDLAAPIPWHAEDPDRISRTRRGRHKEIVQAGFKETPIVLPPTPKSTPKKPQTSVRTQKQLRSGRGEGCGVTTEDRPTSSASLSHGLAGYEERLEPLAAAFTDDEELIALDVHQPIENILQLFFGHASGAPDVHMPMWLLRLLHRCARGDRLTRGAVYHEDFPSIDLCGLQDDEVAMQQQLRNDEEIARQLHVEETMKHRSRSNSPTDSFSPDQIRSVRMLRAKYPAADPASVADIFSATGFNTTDTLSLLALQFGESAPGPAHTLPPSVLAPPHSASSSRSSSSTNFAAAANASAVHARALPTHLANGRITDVAKMAAANGASKTQDEVRQDFIELHEKRAEKQRLLDEALKKAQSVKDHHTRGYYGQEIRRAKEARIQVEQEIAELAQWWNDNLNEDVIDLHWMLADQAMQMLRERIEQRKRGRGTKRLTVITGSGNNSLGGKAEIKQRVVSMCNAQNYKFHHNNNGCIIINLA